MKKIIIGSTTVLLLVGCTPNDLSYPTYPDEMLVSFPISGLEAPLVVRPELSNLIFPYERSLDAVALYYRMSKGFKIDTLRAKEPDGAVYISGYRVSVYHSEWHFVPIREEGKEITYLTDARIIDGNLTLGGRLAVGMNREEFWKVIEQYFDHSLTEIPTATYRNSESITVFSGNDSFVFAFKGNQLLQIDYYSAVG